MEDIRIDLSAYSKVVFEKMIHFFRSIQNIVNSYETQRCQFNFCSFMKMFSFFAFVLPSGAGFPLCSLPVLYARQ